MVEQFTTRLSPRFEDERHAILSRFDRLASDLAQGFPVLEQVSLAVAQAELEAERSRELPSDGDVGGLLDDTESGFSADRDNRRSA